MVSLKPPLPGEGQGRGIHLSSLAIALKGRQITDGGKQRAAPGHGKLITPPPLRRRRQGGVGGRVWRFVGGYALLTPVCTLPPFQGFCAVPLKMRSKSPLERYVPTAKLLGIQPFQG